jgi:hypothetical protein
MASMHPAVCGDIDGGTKKRPAEEEEEEERVTKKQKLTWDQQKIEGITKNIKKTRETFESIIDDIQSMLYPYKNLADNRVTVSADRLDGAHKGLMRCMAYHEKDPSLLSAFHEIMVSHEVDAREILTLAHKYVIQKQCTDLKEQIRQLVHTTHTRKVANLYEYLTPEQKTQRESLLDLCAQFTQQFTEELDKYVKNE